MKPKRQLLKTPITYYGGKQSLLNEVISRFPVHQIYCEPFFGGGAIFFAKPQSSVEVINDLNGEVVNFYRIMQNYYAELNLKIQNTLYSRQLFEEAKVIYNTPTMFNRLDRAYAFWVLANQSFLSNIGSTWLTSSSQNGVSRMKNKTKAFDSYDMMFRIQNAVIENRDALKVIRERDRPNSFFYLDPPYIQTNQGHYKGYSEVDFEKLLLQLCNLKGKFLLSCFPSKLLSLYLSGVENRGNWHAVEIEKYSQAKKTKKIEVLVANYPI